MEVNMYSNNGITHLDHLDPYQFIDVVTNLHRFAATEKIDGANVIIGIDQNNNRFVTRESKGGVRYTTPLSWDVNHPTHILYSFGWETISKLAETLSLPKGFAVECEVISSTQPNVIYYNDPKVILLRPVPLEGCDLYSEYFENIRKELNNQTLHSSVTMDVDDTDNGLELYKRKAVRSFSIVPIQHVDVKLSLPTKILVNKQCEHLKRLLNESVTTDHGIYTKYELMHIKLNYVPVCHREQLKGYRESIKTHVNNHMNDIYQTLATEICNIPSVYNSSPERDPIGIEGVVLTDQDRQFQTKIVDRQKFTELNMFAHSISTQVANLFIPREPHPNASLPLEQDLFHHFLEHLSEIIKIDFTKSYIQHHWIAKDHAKSNRVYNAIYNNKTKIEQLADHHVEDWAKKMLKHYENNKHTYALQLPNNNIISYNKNVSIDNRTKLAFASYVEWLQDIKHFANIYPNSENLHEHLLPKVFK